MSEVNCKICGHPTKASNSGKCLSCINLFTKKPCTNCSDLQAKLDKQVETVKELREQINKLHHPMIVRATQKVNGLEKELIRRSKTCMSCDKHWKHQYINLKASIDSVVSAMNNKYAETGEEYRTSITLASKASSIGKYVGLGCAIKLLQDIQDK